MHIASDRQDYQESYSDSNILKFMIINIESPSAVFDHEPPSIDVNQNNLVINQKSSTNQSVGEDEDDFDEKMDQKQYSENKNKSISQINIKFQNNYIIEESSSERKKVIFQNDNQDEDEYDDGGFLSDEVDEKRSFTPQPRGNSHNQMAHHTPNDQEISINLGNIVMNNISNMNISKISRINNNTQFSNHHVSIHHNKSQLQPYGQISNLGANHNLVINKKQSQNSFTNNASSVDNSKGYNGHNNNNLITSNNNSFISGLQGFAGIAVNSLRLTQNQNNNENIQNRSMIQQSIPIKNKLINEDQNQQSQRIASIQSVPLTARVNTVQINKQNEMTQNDSKVNSVSQYIKQNNEQQKNNSKSGVNMIYKSPMRTQGNLYANSQLNHQNNLNNNVSFGQALFQNIKELSGFRNINNYRDFIDKNQEQIDDGLIANNILKQSNIQRNQNIGQIAQNLKKTPSTSLGLMTSVKNQNSSLAQPINPSLNIELNQKQQNSVNNTFHALMAQKGSKCKCNLKDNDINQILDNNQINTNDKGIYKDNVLIQDYEEITMSSGSGDNNQNYQFKNGNIDHHQYCSTFCKLINQKDQRLIILECLKIEINGLEEGRVTLQSGSQFQQQFILKPSVNKLKRYIIDAKWWAKWCDYCNFDKNDIILEQLYMDKLGMQDQNQQKYEQYLNYNSTNSNRKFENAHLYSKPGRIENECLLESRNYQSGIGGSGIDHNISSMRGLRENIFEHYDFEALYPNVWSHLYSWYSADFCIARYLKLDAFNQDDNLMGSMGSQTLKQALAIGKLDFKDGQNHLKKMELDLYPSKMNSKMLKNQFFYYEEYKKPNQSFQIQIESQIPVDQKSKSINEKLTEKKSGLIAEVTDSKDVNKNDKSDYGSSLSEILGINKLIKSQKSKAEETKDLHEIKSKVNQQKQNKQFIDQKHRPSLKGLTDSKLPANMQIDQQKEISSAMNKIINNTQINQNNQIQQKRNSYSFKNQTIKVKQDEDQTKKLTSTQQSLKEQKQDQNEITDKQPDSFKQKIMNLFQNK